MTGLEALNAICAECQQDKGKIQVACPWRSISGDYCEEYETIKRCIERLAELEDKIEDGRLKEFPCKVRDKVYYIYNKVYYADQDFFSDYFIEEDTVLGYEYYDDGMGWQLILDNNGYIPVSLIGDVFFLTRAEAEKKLKELKLKGEKE